MPHIDRPLKTALPLAVLVLALGSGATWAHGGGGTPGGGSIHAMSRASPSMSAGLAHPPGMAHSRTSISTDPVATAPMAATSTNPPPSFTTGCETETAANCEATAQSRFTVSGGDPSPTWTTPVPTTVPATPAAPAITEPSSSDAQNFERSGGGSGVVITEGGGPTLTDCMALWEPAVHMTKQLWKNVCVRTMNGIDEPQEALDSIDPTYSAHRAHATHQAQRKHEQTTQHADADR